jgi:hypothetical protein
MPTILAVDPGKRTGVAFIEYDNDTAPKLLNSSEVYGGAEGFRLWWQMFAPNYDTLVAENFISREGVYGVDTEPLRVLGFLGQFNPVLQTPAGRKKAVPDDALKRLGLYLPGEKNRNAREAVRHAVWWLKNQGHRPTIRKAFVSINWGDDVTYG